MRRHLAVLSVLVSCAGCGRAPRAPRPPVPPAPELTSQPLATPAAFHYTVRPVLGDRPLPPILDPLHEIGTDIDIGRSAEGFAWAGGRLTKVTLPRNARLLRITASGAVIAVEGDELVRISNGIAKPVGAPETSGSVVNGAGDVATVAETGRTRHTRMGERSIRHAFLWAGGKRTDLGALASDEDSAPTDMNDARQVVGVSGDRAFLWENGTMRELGMVPGFSAARPTMINAKGQVLGECTADEFTGYAVLGAARVQPFLWRSGTMKPLPVPDGARMAFPVGLADDGTSVGYTFSREAPPTPLLWRSGQVYDMNTLLPRHSGWTIWKPLAISRTGEVLALAQGTTANPARVQPGLVLLTPAAGPPRAAAKPAVVNDQGGAVPIPGRSRVAPVSAKPSPPAPVRYEIVRLDAEQVNAPVRFNGRGQVAGGTGPRGSGFFFLDGDARRDISTEVPGALDVCQVTEDGAVLLRGKQGAIVWKDGRACTVPNTQFASVRMNARGDILVEDGPEWIRDGKTIALAGPGDAERDALRPPRHVPNSRRTWARDINDKGQIVGTAAGRPVLWENGRARGLGVLSGFQGGRADTVNNAGQIAGVCTKSGDLGYARLEDAYAQPFLWQNGRMRRLETLPRCPRVFILDMNARGDIIGTDRNHNGGVLIVWLNGHPYDVASLATGDIPWHLDSLQDINDRGEILALGQPEADVGVKGVEWYLLLLRPRPVAGMS